MSANNLILNRFFTQYIFNDLLQNTHNSTYRTIIEQYLPSHATLSNGELISKIYTYMSQHYRNEYFYQNTILNKLLLGRHSLKTTTALTQIPIGKSKADFILINGKATVYEIKTELDDFSRLETQLQDYYLAFDHICVLTGPEHYEKLAALLKNTAIGICLLTKRNTLQTKKEPQPDNTYLSHQAIFKMLHKKEFERLLMAYYPCLPKATPAFYYDACYKAFQQIPITTAYALTLRQLKKRNHTIEDFFSKIPYELKSLMYFSKASEQDYMKLFQFLASDYIRG